MPKTSSGGQVLGFKISKGREREGKLGQRKANRKKEEQTWRHEKPPPFWWVFFLANFNDKTWEH